MLLLAALCFARDVLQPPPERVDTVADGLSLSRPGDQYEGEFPPDPEKPTQAAYEAWVWMSEKYKDRRADLVALDKLMSQFAPTVAGCALEAGDAVGAVGTFTVSPTTLAGQLRVKAAAGGAPGLVACMAREVHKRYPPIAHHPLGGGLPTLAATYTVTLTGAPAAVPVGLDRFSGIAGATFGSRSDNLVEGARASSHRNTEHFTRAFDDNVRFMGVPCLLIFSYDADAGLYGYRVRVTGDQNAFALRDRVKRAAGPGQWDNTVKGWFWRTPEQAWVMQRSQDGLSDELTVLHVERARASGVVSYLPGDENPEAANPSKLLPRVLREPPPAQAPTP